jgi:hypothetical protein
LKNCRGFSILGETLSAHLKSGEQGTLHLPEHTSIEIIEEFACGRKFHLATVRKMMFGHCSGDAFSGYLSKSITFRTVWNSD